MPSSAFFSLFHDFEILELSIAEKRIIVTMDKDFGELVFNSGHQHNGILLLRVEDMSGIEKAQIVRHILENFGEKIINSFSVYQKGKFRIRYK